MARSSANASAMLPRKCLCKMTTFTLILSALVVTSTYASTSTAPRMAGLCRKPPKPENGRFKVTMPGSKPNPPAGFYYPGTVLEYECDNVYTLKGKIRRRTCLLAGNWGGAQPRCEISCGKTRFAPDQTSLIINSEPSKQGAWPWQVALALDFDTLKRPKQIAQPGGTFAAITLIDGWGIACGAVLINSQWVLTAAHCLTDLESGVTIPTNTVMVYAGKQFREKCPGDEKIVQTRMAFEVIIHEDFDFSTQKGDIALILLEKPIVFTKWILPVCLPTTSIVQKSEVVGVVTGWGLTEAMAPSNELQQAVMKVAPPEECEERCPKTIPALRSQIKDGMFCAVDPWPSSTYSPVRVLFGFAGGPLVFPVGSGKNRHWVVHGLVCWGPANCSASVFTDVAYYIDWIIQYVPNN